MQKDQDLHKLFRARLPVAVIPKEFADRLTKAVLDEVAQLHQATPLAINRVDHPLTDARSVDASPMVKGQSPFTHSGAALLFFLLLNLPLWPLLQGCTFNPHSTLSIHLTVSRQSTQPRKVSATLPEAVARANRLPHLAAATHYPPLGPVKPQLPSFRKQAPPRVLVPTIASTPTPTSTIEDSFVNQHGPPEVEQQPASITAVTVPHEQPPSANAVTTEATATEATAAVTPAPTDEPSPPIATTSAEVPPGEPTATSTPTVLQQTPTLNIFEPTNTPTPEPTGPIATATSEPIATPTIYIRPWQTSVPDLTVPPTSEATPVTSTPTS